MLYIPILSLKHLLQCHMEPYNTAKTKTFSIMKEIYLQR